MPLKASSVHLTQLRKDSVNLKEGQESTQTEAQIEKRIKKVIRGIGHSKAMRQHFFKFP